MKLCTPIALNHIFLVQISISIHVEMDVFRYIHAICVIAAASVAASVAASGSVAAGQSMP